MEGLRPDADVSSRVVVGRNRGGRDAAGSREEVGASVEPLRAMVGYWDPDLHNRLLTVRAVEFLGLTPIEIRGCHASEVLGPELYALNRRHIEPALAGQPRLFEGR